MKSVETQSADGGGDRGEGGETMSCTVVYSCYPPLAADKPEKAQLVLHN